MHIDTLIAEIREDYNKYDSQGLINDDSCYRWAKYALKEFGGNIMEIQETLLYVKNGQAQLPDNFFSLYDALRCESDYYCASSSKADTGILDSLMWKERVERKQTWNSCATCCKEESESTITERIYIDFATNDYVDFYYTNPQRLRLGKSTQRSIDPNCRNKYIKSGSTDVITINNKTLYANFAEGVIFLQYKGVPEDEDGKPIIPETPKGNVEKYVEYHLKSMILENILVNTDDTNVITAYQTATAKEQYYKGLAKTDAAFSKLTPASFRRLRNANRIDNLKYELRFPQLQNF